MHKYVEAMEWAESIKLSVLYFFLPYILKTGSLTENGVQIAESKLQRYSILLSTDQGIYLAFYLITENLSSDPYICEIKGIVQQATSTLPLLSLLFLPLRASFFFPITNKKVTFSKVV